MPTKITPEVQGRLNVNWDSYWAGFIKIPFVEFLRFHLIKRACQRLLRPFQPLPGKKICELGSGTGSVSRYLADHYKARPAVVDNNPHALGLCRGKFVDFKGTLEVIERDVFDLKDYKGQFDLVHSGGLIEHFIEEARDEIIRIHCELVKPEGYVMILVPVENRWYNVLNHGIFQWLHLLDEIPEVPWSLEELKEALGRYGFEIVSRTSVISEIGVLARRKSAND